MNLELKRKIDFKKQFRKRCYLFSLTVLKLSDKLLLTNKINKVLIDQLVRSAISIGANIVEGTYSSSKKEFTNYFQIALKSSTETLYWLSLLKEMNIQYADELNKIISECIELKKILSTIILNTKSNSKL